MLSMEREGEFRIAVREWTRQRVTCPRKVSVTMAGSPVSFARLNTALALRLTPLVVCLPFAETPK